MKIIPFYGVAWESNSYLVTEGDDAILIDAGVNCHTVAEQLAKEAVTLRTILLTHGHFDHIISIDGLREQTDAKLAIHSEDAEMLTDAEKSALYTFFGVRNSYRPCDISLSHGDIIPFGEHRIEVIHTPGHSRGSVCYKIGDVLFTGDTIFSSGYGRYDLYGGDIRMLTTSLKQLKDQNPSMTIYPGHGEPALLGTALNRLSGLI